MKTRIRHFLTSARQPRMTLAVMSTLFSMTLGTVNAQTTSDTPSANVADRWMFEVSQAPQEAGAEAKKVAYLLFHIPFAKADFYPLSAPLVSAFTQAPSLVLESAIKPDETQDQITQVNQILRYSNKDNLKKHISKATWLRLNQVTGKQAAQFNSHKAVAVALGLQHSASLDAGHEPDLALDLHFARAAEQQKKVVYHLQSQREYHHRLAQLSDQESDALLHASLQAYPSGKLAQTWATLELAWRSGDRQQLCQHITTTAKADFGSARLYREQITQRNVDVATQLLQYAQAKAPIMAILDASRLCGEQNLLDLLQQRGWQIKAFLPPKLPS